jgi:hypothetical protein
VFRSFINAPEETAAWVAHEKLPATAVWTKGSIYADAAHLFCKGFIEAMFELGLRSKFTILARPTDEVARSLFQMNVIPERTSAGRLVLLRPSDPGVLPLSDWQRFSDYQLCY